MSASTARRDAAVGFGATLAALVGVGVVVMGRAVTSCSTVVRGAPGDGTAGAVWLGWAWDRTGGGPFTSTQYLSGAGRGDGLWRPRLIVNLLVELPHWALTRLAGPVCGYNLALLFGFVTSGIGMWLLVRHLTPSRLVAGGAAVVFAYTGFTQMKAEVGHISWVHLALFPLMVLVLLRLWERPDRRRVVVAGVVWGGFAYVDGYDLTFGLVLVTGFVLGVSVATLARHRGRQVRWVVERLATTALAGVVAVVVMLPYLVVVLSDFSTIDAQTTRPLDDAVRYAARWFEYVTPSPRHPAAPDWYSRWRVLNGHRSNAGESNIFLGWVPLGLALVAVVRRRTWVVAGLVGVAVVGAVCSFSPDLELFGLPLPMPSRLMHAVLPQLRAFSRLFAVVDTGVVALAAVGADHLLRARPASSRRLLGVLAVGVALAESLTFTPGDAPVWSYSRTPEVFAAVGADPDVDVVAVYPLDTADTVGDVVFTYQPVFEKVLVNSPADTGDADDPADVARAATLLTDPQTVPALRAVGTDAVVVRQATDPSDAEARRLGLEFVRRYACDDPGRDRGRDCLPSSLWRVLPGPVPTSVLALGAGWSTAGDGWSGSHLARDGAQVTAVPLDVAPTAHELHAVASSPTGRATVDVVDGDEVLATFQLDDTPSRVVVPLPAGTTVRLRVTSTADREATLSFSSLDLVG